MRAVTPMIHGDLRVFLHLMPWVEGCTLWNEGLLLRNGGVIAWNRRADPGNGGGLPRNHGIVRGMMA